MSHFSSIRRLYLIEILHQTTTYGQSSLPYAALYLIEILHQTTTYGPHVKRFRRCILSKFYIKPQLTGRTLNGFDGCILSKFYIKPQPVGPGKTVKLCCILSKFYIKPQHSYQCPFLFVVVSYRNSTSNHNRARTAETSKRLYLIEILHQTTTFTSAR